MEEKTTTQDQEMPVEGEKPTKKPRNGSTDQGLRNEERKSKPRSFLEVLMAQRRREGPARHIEKPGNTSTPVRKKVQRIEENLKIQSGNARKRKRCLGGQGRPPSPLQEMKEVKQAKISSYYGRKSPKADHVRSRKCLEQQPNQETEVIME